MNNNEQVKTKSDIDDKNERKGLDFMEIFKYISGLLTFIYTLSIVIKNFYNYIYSIKAEIFYGIPRYYFYENVFGEINIKLIFVVILVLILFIPIIIKRFGKKIIQSRLEASAYSAIVSVLILNMLLTLVIDIISNYKLEYINNSLFYGIIIIGLILIITLVFFYLYYDLLANNHKSTKSDKDTKNSKDTPSPNGKDKKTILYAIITTVFIIGYFALFFINIEWPENKNNYEVIFEEGKPKKIVVTEYKDCFVLMDIEDAKRIKKFDGEEGIKLLIKKHSYKLRKKENLMIEYIHIDEVSTDK